MKNKNNKNTIQVIKHFKWKYQITAGILNQISVVCVATHNKRCQLVTFISYTKLTL
jgi:hypothetical protein